MKNKDNKKGGNIKDIDCKDAIGRLMDYLDHYLTADRMDELEKHLESCRSCMDRYEFQKSLKTKISSLANRTDPSFSRNLKNLLDSL